MTDDRRKMLEDLRESKDWVVQEGDPFDVCYCGDYRHQHDERGCKVCRAMPSLASPRCLTFRLAKEARL
jgi:hypothetical protein